MNRWLGALLLAVIIALVASGSSAAQADDLSARDRQFQALHCQGKYPEAATVGERVLKIREEALGPEHAGGGTYDDQGRYEEAPKAYSRALAIEDKALGSAHLYQTLGRSGT